jgi:hypothetical protein
MFNFDFLTFEFFGNFVVFSSVLYPLFSDAIIFPLFADMEDWIPDFAKDFGKYLTNSFQGFVDRVKGFFDWLSGELFGYVKYLADCIKQFSDGVQDIISKFWIYVCDTFNSWADWFYSIVEWCGECLLDFYEWLEDLYEHFWDLAASTIVSYCEWLLESWWNWNKWVWEISWRLVDDVVSIGLEMLTWLLDKMPSVDIPEGFNQGVTYFVQFGMLLNEILPIRESLMLLELYIMIIICFTIYRYIKRYLFFV